jgi:hypothetical protein
MQFEGADHGDFQAIGRQCTAGRPRKCNVQEGRDFEMGPGSDGGEAAGLGGATVLSFLGPLKPMFCARPGLQLCLFRAQRGRGDAALGSGGSDDTRRTLHLLASVTSQRCASASTFPRYREGASLFPSRHRMLLVPPISPPSPKAPRQPCAPRSWPVSDACGRSACL